MSMMEVFPLFSTPVSVRTFENRISSEDLANIKSEEYHAYPKQLDGSCTVDEQILEKYPDLKQLCIEHCSEYIHSFLAVEDNLYMDIPCSWVNKHPTGHSANRHGHTNSMFTGCLYLDVPEDSGNLIFEASYNHATWNTGTLDPPVWEDNVQNSRKWHIKPENGMIVCFPSHVDHYTGVNNNTEDRYSLGFNIMLCGDFSAPTRRLIMDVYREPEWSNVKQGI